MITFLITPVKSKRDSLLMETPACKLTFDVAETPVLFDSLSVNQLRKIQSLNDNVSTVKTNKTRESLCNLSICNELPFLSNRQSIYSANGELPYIDSPSPVTKLFDTLDFEKDGGLTPANVFNQTLNKIHDEYKDEEETETDFIRSININNKLNNDDGNGDIVSSIQYNNQFCITMLITKQQLSQQKIYQYLMANNEYGDDNYINPRNLNIIKSCDCIPCKHRNWNVVDIRWEKQWQSQQFIFNVEGTCKYQSQINDVNCENITSILQTNGILQKEIYIDAQKTFYRKIMRKGIPPNSNQQSCRRKRKRLSIGNKNKAKDKKIMLQHLATWSRSLSSCTSIIEYDGCYCDDAEDVNQMQQNIEYLPVICKEDNGCSYISCETLMDIMDGSLDISNLFDFYVIIDCRYDYEYLGGHINGAINVSDKLLIELLFKSNMNLKHVKSHRIAWIFHCEYSKHRGPQTCKYFRKFDREINADQYPYISYPHTYVLQGGYKKFWYQYKDSYYTLKNKIFSPFGYISMWNEVFDDKRFIYSQFRKDVWKKHKKKNQTKLTCRNGFV